ncbi:MAG: DUF4293 domain-containing protein [Bacteroidales bacterium]|nr:DUF4293 domain-containing protein [Bacteroidales bacterium]
MIQRIQTLFLILAFMFLSLVFFFPYATFIDPQAVSYTFDISGIYSQEETNLVINILPLQILIAVVPAISLVSIFLYKNRILQMRLCVFNMLLMAGMLILMAYYIFYIKGELSAQVYYKVTLLFPLISMIFTWLAFRSIRKDELLIRSVERIR